MDVTVIEFSPTGGTAKAARILAEGLGTVRATIDLADRATDFAALAVDPGTVAVVAVPSFGGRVPAPPAPSTPATAVPPTSSSASAACAACAAARARPARSTAS